MNATLLTNKIYLYLIMKYKLILILTIILYINIKNLYAYQEIANDDENEYKDNSII